MSVEATTEGQGNTVAPVAETAPATEAPADGKLSDKSLLAKAGEQSTDAADGRTPDASEGAETGEQGRTPGDGEGEEQESVEYNFDNLEGLEIDQGKLDQALPVFQKHNLSQETANDLLTMYQEIQQADAEAYWAKVDQDVAEFQKDPKFEDTITMANRFLRTHATPEENALLSNVHMGSNPTMVRFMARMHQMLGDDTVTHGDTSPTESVGDRMYPTMK